VITGCAIAIGLSLKIIEAGDIGESALQSPEIVKAAHIGESALQSPKIVKAVHVGENALQSPKIVKAAHVGENALPSPSFPSQSLALANTHFYMCVGVALRSKQTDGVHMNRLAYPLPEARALNHPKSLRSGMWGHLVRGDARPAAGRPNPGHKSGYIPDQERAMAMTEIERLPIWVRYTKKPTDRKCRQIERALQNTRAPSPQNARGRRAMSRESGE
jgi:hypothetical protein